MDRLVETSLGQLNRGLLILRIGLYLVAGVGLLTSGEPAAIPVALGLALIAFLPALPGRLLADIRIEVGVLTSLLVEAALWWWFGALPGLGTLPLLSTAVAGLLLPRRRAISIAGLGLFIQLTQALTNELARRDVSMPGLHSGTHEWSEIVAETILQIVVGIGFVGLGSILRRYQQRVIDQSNEELRLTELIREKDSLIDTVAHELRTPLTAVLGFTSEMGRSQRVFDPEELRVLSQTVAFQSRKLAHIIDNLVVGARSEVSGLAVKVAQVELGAFVADAWAGVGLEPGDLIVHGDGIAFGDRDRLRHLLDNLFDNCVRHGRPPVEISIESHRAEVTISVRDAGPGLPEHLSGSDFGRYTGASNGTSPATFGLGLSVAATLARSMRGMLTCSEGAVSVTLPAPIRHIQLVS